MQQFHSGLQGASSDYIPLNTFLRFSSTVSKQCTPISIIDDSQIEQLEESFILTLERADNTPDGVLLTCDEATVIIIDNDGNHSKMMNENCFFSRVGSETSDQNSFTLLFTEALLGFEMAALTVHEGNDREVVLCVEVKQPVNIICPVAYPTEFFITIKNGTAGIITSFICWCFFVTLSLSLSLSLSDKNWDYIDPGYTEENPFRYGACARRDCFSIVIVDDNNPEDTESFTVSLNSTTREGCAVQVEQNILEITIIDGDG